MKGKESLPFEEVKPHADLLRQIPSKPSEFVNFVRFLATSPHIDPSPVADHILQFFNLPKLKKENGNAVYFALGDISMPETFWTQLVLQIKQQLSPTHELADGMLYALGSAPAKVILSQFTTWEFLKEFLRDAQNAKKYAAFRLLHIFRSQIKFDDEFVELTLQEITSEMAGLVMMCLNLVIFLWTVEFPGIEDLIVPYKNDIWRMAMVHGHLMNTKHISFIVKIVKPDVRMIGDLLPHVSLSSACYLLASLPANPDFMKHANFPSDVVIPVMLDIIRHRFSESMRSELFMTTLYIVLLHNDQTSFESLAHLLISDIQVCSIEVIALVCHAAVGFGILPKVLKDAYESEKKKDMFCDLTAVAAIFARNEEVDVTTDLLNLLCQQSDGRSWRMAAACVAWYMWVRRPAISTQVLETVCKIKDSRMRGLFLVYLARIGPTHLRSSLVKEMQETLLPAVFKCSEDPRTVAVPERPDGVDIPLVMKLCLLRSIFILANTEEMNHMQQFLTDPIWAMTAQNALKEKQAPRDDQVPISPFAMLDLIDIERICLAVEVPQKPPQTDFLGIHRPFVEISPAYHALTVEISTVITRLTRSLCIDLRLSTKRMVPDVSVSLLVPPTLSPSYVAPWVISELKEDTTVMHRFSFTVHDLKSPYARICVTQAGATVMDVRICLPLIDLFLHIEPTPENARDIWNRMHREHPHRVDLSDGVWFMPNEGSIAVRSNVARSTRKCLLKLLPSIKTTSTVIE